MIYVMRHGETDANKEQQRQGWEDTELNDEGYSQCAWVRMWLSDRHIDKIYSSDLCRAEQTAYSIAHNMKTIELTSNLRERNWGYEDSEDVAVRVSEFLRGIDQSQDVLIVTHGNTARHIIAQLSGCPVSEVEPFGNCEVRWPTALQESLFGDPFLAQWANYRPSPSR